MHPRPCAILCKQPSDFNNNKNVREKCFLPSWIWWRAAIGRGDPFCFCSCHWQKDVLMSATCSFSFCLADVPDRIQVSSFAISLRNALAQGRASERFM